MKKLICYFILISALRFGIGIASSKYDILLTKEEIQELADTDPYKTISKMFAERLHRYDYREKARIIVTPDVISYAYPERPDLQAQAIDAWGQCMKEQMVNGRRKYTDKDIYVLTNFSKKKLGLK